MGEKLQLKLLGPPEISLAGVPVSEPILGKAQAILYYLAVTGCPQPRSTLATLLWGDMPEATARTNLRKALANLRRVVGSYLDIGQQAVAFKPASDYWVDVVEFEAKMGDAATATEVARLEAGIELYRGDFLTGFQIRHAPDFESWLLVERERLRELLVQALSLLAAHHAERGELAQGVVYTRRLLALEPWREEAHRQLMLLLVCDGQRSAALTQYETCRQALAEELGVEPGQETKALYERICAGKLSRGVRKQRSGGAGERGSGEDIFPAPAPAHNLPAQLIPFVGREQELAEIIRLLHEEPVCRLLTLTGPGGIGKTRLALEVAAAALKTFPNGVYFVRLASLTSAEHIVSTLAENIGFRFYGAEEPKKQLLDYLRQKQMLLVLDNFEHLLTGVDLVVEILQAAPGVMLLVTSRERLNLSEETIYTLGGLALPERAAAPEASISDAVALFLQRARLIRPDFEARADELNQIGCICHLAQGMPLAIVLAAGWLEMLSLQEVVSEMAQSLDFLETEMRDVPQRQRSMRAVFGYSWQRLSAAEQQTFMKLSLFRGGFTRQAAQQVAGANLRTLRALVNKSLVTASRAERYEIHELLRQYGEEQLAASGQDGPARKVHSNYYLSALQQREAGLKGDRQLAALNEIETDFENIRAAWGWALQQQDQAAIDRALESLHLFCDIRARYQEGIEFFRLAGEQFEQPPGEEPQLLWGRILARLCFLRLYRPPSPVEQIEVALTRSLAIAQKYDQRPEIAYSLLALGAYYIWLAPDDAIDALTFLEQSLEHYRALDDHYYIARTLIWVGVYYALHADPLNFQKYTRQSLKLARENGNKMDTATSLFNLAEVAFGLGDYATAEKYGQESVATAGEVGLPMLIASSYALLGLGAFLQGDLAKTKTKAEESLEIAQDINHRLALAYAQGALGLWAAVKGEYSLGSQLGQECLIIPGNNSLGLILPNWALSIINCGLQSDKAAWQRMQAVLKLSSDLAWLAPAAWLLPVAAFVLAHQGQNERAVELLALAYNHPLSSTGWLEQWSLLTKLRASLETELDTAIHKTAWERGSALDLEKVVMELLAEFEEADSQPGTPSPSKALAAHIRPSTASPYPEDS